MSQYMIHHGMRDSITRCLMAGGGNTEMWINPSQLFQRVSKFIHVRVCLSEAIGAKTTFTLSQRKSQSAIVLRGGFAANNSSEGEKKKVRKKIFFKNGFNCAL